jgi:hypothetical protein
MMKNRIHVGDEVVIKFWPYCSDIEGEVEYKPTEFGDSWIIVSEDGSVHYIQHFASITKRPSPAFNDAPF